MLLFVRYVSSDIPNDENIHDSNLGVPQLLGLFHPMVEFS